MEVTDGTLHVVTGDSVPWSIGHVHAIEIFTALSPTIHFEIWSSNNGDLTYSVRRPRIGNKFITMQCSVLFTLANKAELRIDALTSEGVSWARVWATYDDIMQNMAEILDLWAEMTGL